MTRFLPLLLLAVVACTQVPSKLNLSQGDSWAGHAVYDNFEISGQALAEGGATASIGFCRSADNAGYEMIIHNGVPDGSLKTGSLHSVRNLYRSLASDGEWFDFCGLTPDDIWFPSMSIRAERPQ